MRESREELMSQIRYWRERYSTSRDELYAEYAKQKNAEIRAIKAEQGAKEAHAYVAKWSAVDRQAHTHALETHLLDDLLLIDATFARFTSLRLDSDDHILQRIWDQKKIHEAAAYIRALEAFQDLEPA